MGPGYYYLGKEEKEALCLAIEKKEVSRYLQGDLSYVDKFEEQVCQLFQIKHCLGMNSCTSALYAGIKHSGIKNGDEVIVSSYTFVATIAAIVLNGAVPVFANVDSSFSIDPKDIEKRITPRTKAIIAVHMLGNPCDMEQLTLLCQKYQLILIEDVAQAFGGSFQKKALGTFGLFGAFSLNGFKIITAGDGGFLTTNDGELYHNVFAFHDHGFYESNNRIITEDSNFGLNLRMHELTGCVAYEQIKKSEFILQRLRKQKKLFKEVLGDNSKFAYRKLNDTDGDCASVTVITFEQKDMTEKFCEKFRTHDMGQSKKHCYNSMLPILLREIPGYNFDASSMAPTDDLLSRSVILSTGMSDNYIGSSVGYTILESDDIIVQKAEEIRQFIQVM